ncbi:MAG: DUF3310 domain-containing protein [Peptococcaceae bacterium]|nr:DUF3310 domain-containing protein [Peptococcaceae bacterium]
MEYNVKPITDVMNTLLGENGCPWDKEQTHQSLKKCLIEECYEVIDAIEEWGLNFSLGNAVKYIARADHKGKPVEDLEKARWYIDREIERRKGST